MHITTRARRVALFAIAIATLASCTAENPGDTADANRPEAAAGNEPARYTTWDTYSGGAHASQYSALDQIDKSNVNELEVAWTYRSGDGATNREASRSHWCPQWVHCTKAI